MSERYSIGIEFVGRDDASDEIRSVAEGLQKLGEANEQVVARAKEVVRSAREERTVLRAVQEGAQVFGERSQFVARQLGEVAGFASTVSKMITALDTSFTRLNTAQLALASAQERQREVLRELNELYGIQATNLKEAEEALRRMLESGEASGRSAEALKESLRKVKDAQKELASASAEVERAVQSMNAQLIAGVSSLELVPKFMSVVNGISALVSISPTLSSALGALRTGFAALYASMGPVGLALLAVGTAAAVIAANWESIAPVFEQVASSVQSVLSPALDWLRVSVLEPLASLLGNVVTWALAYIVDLVRSWYSATSALGEALGWFWNEVLVPVATYLAGQVKGALDLVSQAVSLLEGAWSSMGSALDAVWKNVIVPLVAFLVEQVLATLRSVSDGARAMAEVFAGAFRAIYDAALSFLKHVLDLVNSIVSGIQEAFSWLHRQLVGAPSSQRCGRAWPRGPSGASQRSSAASIVW
jgi:phage-related protein